MKTPWIGLCALLAGACGDRTGQPGATTNPISSGPDPSRVSTAGQVTSVTSVPTAALPALPKPLPSGPTHYSVKAAPPANASCASIPKDGPPAFAPVAKAARRLACEPALFFLSLDALRAELALPPAHELEFGAPSAITIRFPKGSAVDLATALGVADGVAMRKGGGAWGWRIWNMARKGSSEPMLDRWSPARVSVSLAVDDAVDDKIDEYPLEKSTVRGSLSVSMPESVLPIIDDPLALAMLEAAVARLAQDKARLADEPADVAKRVGLANDRFRLSRRSLGTGPNSIHGIDIWVARTRVAAAPIIDMFGLPGKIEHSRAHDSDEFLLYDGVKTEFEWRGLKVQLGFDKRTGAAAPGRHGEFVLERITLMP
jgi:hypothetical protein